MAVKVCSNIVIKNLVATPSGKELGHSHTSAVTYVLLLPLEKEWSYRINWRAKYCVHNNHANFKIRHLSIYNSTTQLSSSVITLQRKEDTRFIKRWLTYRPNFVRLQWRLLPLYLIGLSVLRRIQPGEGLFLFLATPRVRLVLKDFCDGYSSEIKTRKVRKSSCHSKYNI